jgi:predicted ATPase
VLEALGRLCRAAEGQRLIALLAQHAPTWLTQMPALVSATELEALQPKTAGVTRERMLRELAEAVEVLTAEHPLVLWLEDLHWCDHSTLDWLSFLARRRERARILVIGSYRPVEVIVREHPLWTVKQDLHVHGQCEELALGLLSEAAVGEYLAQRFPSYDCGGAERRPLADARDSVRTAGLPRLAHVIHRRTDGNPLFMVTVVNALPTQEGRNSGTELWELQDDLEQAAATIP